MGKTSIEWTRGDDGTAGSTWNPIRGCSRVSPGCGGPHREGGCYAEKIAARFSGPGQPFESFAKRNANGGTWTGKMALVDDMLTLPLRWRKPRRIFVNSMSDLFHENLPDEAIDKVFAVMALAPQHTYQILTKRSARMRAYMTAPDVAKRVWLAANEIADDNEHIYLHALAAAGGDWGGATPWPLPNVWLGVSTEDQLRADERIPDLLETPTAVRFLSCEPLLGPLILDGRNMVADETYWNWLKGERGPSVQHAAVRPEKTARIDLAIVGGESGPRSRPFQVAWAAAIVDQCKAAGVAVFVKQLGAKPAGPEGPMRLKDRKGGDMAEWPENLRVREMPQKGDNSP